MFKKFIMATALLVAVAGTTLAQSSATAEVSANVQAELTIVNDVAMVILVIYQQPVPQYLTQKV